MESECRFTVPPVGGRTQIYFSWGQYYDSMIDPQKKKKNTKMLLLINVLFAFWYKILCLRSGEKVIPAWVVRLLKVLFTVFLIHILQAVMSFYWTEKRRYQRKLFYKVFSCFPLSKIKQEDSWRWWQSHIDYSCSSTSWCSLPFPSLFPKSFWPASNPSLHRFHIQRQEHHGQV